MLGPTDCRGSGVHIAFEFVDLGISKARRVPMGGAPHIHSLLTAAVRTIIKMRHRRDTSAAGPHVRREVNHACGHSPQDLPRNPVDPGAIGGEHGRVTRLEQREQPLVRVRSELRLRLLWVGRAGMRAGTGGGLSAKPNCCAIRLAGRRARGRADSGAIGRASGWADGRPGGCARKRAIGQTGGRMGGRAE